MGRRLIFSFHTLISTVLPCCSNAARFSYSMPRSWVRRWSICLFINIVPVIKDRQTNNWRTRLTFRIYDINDGEIRTAGKDIRQVSRHSLRQCYGMVLQDTWLKAGTVRENIAYGDPEATEEQIIAAAKAAHAHSFIRRLPGGYDTVIAENGENLSAGQRQLLCIARAMLKLPPMLILDEATSSIDTRTELKIQDAFSKMMQGRTSFIVAHRLSTIRSADVILVMKDGSVIEQGNHRELMKQNGFYAKLYNSQ